jgi:hypothetical protein
MAALFGALFLVPVITIAGIMTGVHLIDSQRFHRQSLFEAAVHDLTHGFPPDLSTSSSRLFSELALSHLQCVPRTQRTTR